MGLSKEEKEQLEALTRKANEPDEDDRYEIEIGSGDKYARVPYRKGRGFLQEHFGIDLDPSPESDDDQDPAAERDNGKGKDKAQRSKAPDQNEGSQRTGHWSGRIDRNTA